MREYTDFLLKGDENDILIFQAYYLRVISAKYFMIIHDKSWQ